MLFKSCYLPKVCPKDADIYRVDWSISLLEIKKKPVWSRRAQQLKSVAGLRKMSPHFMTAVTTDDENRNENCSPASQEMHSPKPKGRVLYCRKCEGHGEKVILKNHSPQCPYILCNCKSCEKLNYKRLKSFNKRNKEKIELAAALNAKRHATESSSSVDEEDGFSRRSSFCSKTSTPGMDTDNSSNTPVALASPAVVASTTSNSSSASVNTSTAGLEGRSMSLGSMTVMSYDIWKAKCASEKKRLEEERAKKTSGDPFTRSPSPTPVRKRAHTFVAQPMNRAEDIPVVAPKKMSVDEKGKGKYILLPTIPAMRIFVNETEEEKPVPVSPVMIAPQPVTVSVIDIPSTSTNIRPFQIPVTTAPMLPLPRPAPVIVPHPVHHQMSPFKPVSVPQLPAPSPVISTTSAPMMNSMSTEQIISSLTLHNTVLQQQQNSQMMQELLQNLGNPNPQPQPQVDMLSLLRLQQQAAALAAALQAAGVQVPITSAPALPILAAPKPIPTTPSLLNPFLQAPLYTNSTLLDIIVMFVFFFFPVFTFAAILIPNIPIGTTVPAVASDPTPTVSSNNNSESVKVQIPDAFNAKIAQRLPFLKGTDELNRQEFFAIIQDEKLSKAEIWEKVEKWAEQQSGSVQGGILEFHQRLSQHVENSKSRVERIIKNLPDALRKLSEIVQDIDITRLQEKNRITNLYTSLDEDVSKTLQWIVQLVSYEKNEGRTLERRSKLRKLKKSGIWKGSVQATNII
ncbi:unnamed protein product [Caenorhabditis sp. 36 PRJEB53466]|nr:unnamed protein product [Caenorhabditis sp. 36 PRJEB53466]